MDRLLTIGEAASLLATTAKALYSRVHRGQIGPPTTVYLGKSLRFRESQLFRLMKSGHGQAMRGRPLQNLPTSQDVDPLSTGSAKNPGGRPRVMVSLEELKRLRSEGMSWRRIGRILGIGPSTAFHLWQDGTTPKAREKPVQKPPGDDSGG